MLSSISSADCESIRLCVVDRSLSIETKFELRVAVRAAKCGNYSWIRIVHQSNVTPRFLWDCVRPPKLVLASALINNNQAGFPEGKFRPNLEGKKYASLLVLEFRRARDRQWVRDIVVETWCGWATFSFIWWVENKPVSSTVYPMISTP